MIEFDKYRRLGAYHWREYKRPSIYRRYVDGLRAWVIGERILDVGAGDGLIAHVIGACGIEIDPVAVALARDRGVDVIEGNAADLPYRDGSFDTVFMGDVIEHLEDPSSALRQAHRVLTTGGALYVTTPPKRTPIRKYHYREYTSVTLRESVEPIGFSSVGETFTAHERIHAKFQKV